MPSPQINSAATRSNPRRRQRNASEDSVANRQPVKRRKRSALSKQTFEAPVTHQVNGYHEDAEDTPLANGSTHESFSARPDKRDGTNLALRHRESRKSATPRRSESHDGDFELTKNDNYTVTHLLTTPDVLLKSLKHEQWRANLYPQLGQAIATTQTSAIVWRYLQDSLPTERLKSTHIPIPNSPNSPSQPLPIGVLVPTSAEPAILILLPKTGRIIYWESLSDAASIDANRQQQSSTQGNVSGIMSGETITKVSEAEPRGFILTLSTGRLAHLAIKDSHGRPSLDVQFLRSSSAQQVGIFGSLRGVFSTAGWKKNITAVKPGRSVQRGQRYVLAATTHGNFQLWDLNWNGTHQLTYEVDAKADLLHASFRGSGDVQSPHHYSFEVLDFAFLPHGSHGRDVAKTSTSGDCRILALTALGDEKELKYTLIGLSLTGGKATVDVVHQITYYTSDASNHSRFKPHLVMPEPAETALVAFEKALVLVSLVEIEDSPSSQLQLESHSLPTPFQDVVALRQDKPYYVVACVAEPQDQERKRSSCSFLIHGYGMIRLSTQPMENGESPISRAAVTARTKIEQAVFFGSHKQNLIDFSPRLETRFSSEAIERAALDISHSIASSTSAYVTALEPNMQHSLSKRAAALSNLIQYLRNYHSNVLSAQTRWQLLWNAEKMAAAEAVWQWYNRIISERPTDQKDLLAEMIECISEKVKRENQPELGESDGVRHYLIHDVWRLEWLIPRTQETVNTLFKEGIEDKEELDLLTKARMIGDAAEVQSGMLETAFQFREANVETYGFSRDRMSDGIFRSVNDFENLDEFWTSSTLGEDTPAIPGRVKELTETTRAMAKLLANDVEEYLERQEEGRAPVDGQKEIDIDATHAAMFRLASLSPRQVHACCQTYIECSRWFRSRKTAKERLQGEHILQVHCKIRRYQFVDLTELSLVDNAIALAEKYGDMEALLDIFEQESEHNQEIQRSLPARIERYFGMFEAQWADAYFTRSLRNGKSTVDILNNNASYSKYLTDFLRSHPEYSNMTWINEISTERDYASAVTSLEQSTTLTDDLWSQKVMLSLHKLSVQAAMEKDQTQRFAGGPRVERVDQQAAILSIQDSVNEYFEPYIRMAIDDDAAVDVVLESFGKRSTEDKPFLRQQFSSNLARLFRRTTLLPSGIIDILTLMDRSSDGPDTSDLMWRRFFLALKVFKLSSTISHTPVSTTASALRPKIIWRRILISSDWTSLNRTEMKSDSQVSSETSTTALFQTLLEGHRNRFGGEDEESFWDTTPPPTSLSELVTAGTDLAELRDLPEYADIPDPQLSKLVRDHKMEGKMLKRYIDKGRLEDWYKGVLEAAKNAYSDEVDRKGEEEAEKAKISVMFTSGMSQQDRQRYLADGTVPEGFEEVTINGG